MNEPKASEDSGGTLTPKDKNSALVQPLTDDRTSEANHRRSMSINRATLTEVAATERDSDVLDDRSSKMILGTVGQPEQALVDWRFDS